MDCPICRSHDTYPLPVPGRGQAVLSDGRVIARPQAKQGCRRCGAAFHAAALSAADVDAFYDREYSLAANSLATGEERAGAYADWIAATLGPLGVAKVLDVGCGSGALLEALSSRNPGIAAVGLDPALAADRLPSAGKPALRRGRIESIGPDENFDLMVAVNVIEHIFRPVCFLLQLRERLRPNGRIVLICPAADPPNLELLFFDHLTTFTCPALAMVAHQAGLQILAHHFAPPALGDFQMAVLAAGDHAPDIAAPPEALERARIRHLDSWLRLDENLARRTDGAPALRMFGAGEKAALLHAYAPLTWARVELLAVDPSFDRWRFDRPIVSYGEVPPDPARPMIVAVALDSQGRVAERLRRDGHAPVVWADLIATSARAPD